MLYTDSAVAGEAAGIGMGLLLAGSGSDKAAEMLAYAHDTQHEKIIRGEEAEGVCDTTSVAALLSLHVCNLAHKVWIASPFP